MISEAIRICDRDLKDPLQQLLRIVANGDNYDEVSSSAIYRVLVFQIGHHELHERMIDAVFGSSETNYGNDIKSFFKQQAQPPEPDVH